MAARNRPIKADESIRINFRLNPRRPKERLILEFLRQHVENYDASRIIKQALYEMATGRSWVNSAGPPLTPEVENTQVLDSERTNQVLDDIVSGLGDWLEQ